MVKDPVCGMQVDPQKTAIKTDYHDQTYYFCSALCKGIFDREPEKYAVFGKPEHNNQQQRLSLP